MKGLEKILQTPEGKALASVATALREQEENQLAPEFKVACQIYGLNLKNKPVWFGKLVKTLKLSESIVGCALSGLEEWGIIKGEYGAIDKNRAGKCYYITSECKTTIKEVYERYWHLQFKNTEKEKSA